MGMMVIAVSLGFWGHMLYLLIRTLLRDNNYNQNIYISDGEPVTNGCRRDGQPLMHSHGEQERTRFGGAPPERVTSDFSGVYIRLYQMDTGVCYDAWLDNWLEIGRQCSEEGSQILILEDPLVSKRHCMLYRQGEQIMIQDLGSTNGTCVNGCLLEGAMPVSCNDRLRIGGKEYQLQCFYQG